jgi:predicted phage-related endonuclease
MGWPMALDLELRKSGFTSTDMGAVFGVDERRDLHSIWAMKVGGLIPPPATWRMRLGQYLERAVINIYADMTGKPVTPLFDKTFRHPKYPHVLATPDALGDDLGVDAKVSSWDQRHQWGQTADDIPDRVQMQVATCMEVLDKDAWDVALLSGDEFRIITVERDREFGTYIMEEAERVWAKYFETREAPPIGGSRTSAAWLQQTYPKERRRPDMRLATGEEIDQLRRYGRLRASQKGMEATRREMENWIKNAIQDREGLQWEGGKFTWRRTKDSHPVGWQAMALALMTNFIKDDETRQRLMAEYTGTEPGTRRIYFKSDECLDAEVDDAA